MQNCCLSTYRRLFLRGSEWHRTRMTAPEFSSAGGPGSLGLPAARRTARAPPPAAFSRRHSARPSVVQSTCTCTVTGDRDSPGDRSVTTFKVHGTMMSRAQSTSEPHALAGHPRMQHLLNRGTQSINEIQSCCINAGSARKLHECDQLPVLGCRCRHSFSV